MMTLVTGIIGIAMLLVFLGILAWWIKALPFTIIVAVVVLMLLYDFIQTVRHGNSGGGR
jgi:membrane protein implicated in regulation of membrane protease activity